jgi:hypothetical protein
MLSGYKKTNMKHEYHKMMQAALDEECEKRNQLYLQAKAVLDETTALSQEAIPQTRHELQKRIARNSNALRKMAKADAAMKEQFAKSIDTLMNLIARSEYLTGYFHELAAQHTTTPMAIISDLLENKISIVWQDINH